MNASYEWLREFVAFDLAPEDVRDLITARCATVDDMVQLRGDLKDIVVGRVVEAQPHPNSDHLNLTKVDAGTGELLDVVCGAPNVTVGTLYPFAPVGAVLPGGLKIEKRKIRGETSCGMLCSARELGLSEEHEGIMALNIDVAPGTPFMAAMPVGDTMLVIDVLPNRPDLLSHEGIAREIAAAVGAQIASPAIPGAADIDDVARMASGVGRVVVEDHEGCPRYMGAVIRGVKVGPSPDWLKRRIESVGGRSINNIVDVTNYMLHGFGQPMHAFDLSKLAGDQIVVRRAKDGETTITLDGVERKLTDSMLVIADSERPQAVAGVMGGAGSGVTENTTDVFLEVAAFNQSRIRATRKALNLSTDASYRFERGVDVHALPRLLNYAVQMILAVAGGAVDTSGVSDVYNSQYFEDEINLRIARIARLLGEPVSEDEAEELLSSVGFTVTRPYQNPAPTGIPFTPHDLHPAPHTKILYVKVPSWRSDVTREVDLIEEIARLRGYDTFSQELRPFRPSAVPMAPLHLVSNKVRETLVSAGLLEVRPMPFVSEGSVRVANPLAANEAFLRDNLLDTLSRRAEYNLAHMQGNVRIFEIGTVFFPPSDPGTTPHEEMRAAILVMGDRHPAHFTSPKPPKIDEWDAKWLAELVTQSAYPLACIDLAGNDSGWDVEADGIVVGKVKRLQLDAPVWASPAYGIEINLQLAEVAGVIETSARTGVGRYKPLPTTPAVEVDLALIVPQAMEAGKVESVIRHSAGELLESLQLFDEFIGAGVAEGSRSLAWRLTFRHPERTLRDKEIEGRRDKILRTLEGELGVKQRT